jgi:aminoglycoside/choline kinase family phosphotransferase
MERLVQIYVDAREAAGEFDRESFFKSYAIMTAQRSCRLNGLWVRLWQRDHMQSYMKHMPRTLWHLNMAFEHPITAPLREWCNKAGIPTAESPEV